MTLAWRLAAGTAAVLSVATMLCPVASQGATLPAGFGTRTLVSGLSFPTGVAWAPDGRMFIATKDGKVYATDANGANARQIIDISSQVNTHGDRGLLGIAVDAQYPSPPYLYLLYTANSAPGNPTGAQVSQLRRVVLYGDSSVPDPNGQVILGIDTLTPCPTDNTRDCIPSDGSSHSIGTVRSDSDGTLWVGSGDAAGFDDVDPLAFRAGDENSLAGKILHIDRNGQGLSPHPFCPSDPTLSHNCTKLYAKGFRNPFRFTLRPGAGPAAADVGWNRWEELDLLRAGGDYGWPCLEGTHPAGPGYTDRPACDNRTLATTQSPVFEYAHDGASAAIIGGPTYSGGGSSGDYPPNYVGSTFFGDYVRGTLRRYDPNTNTTTTFGWDAKPWVDLESAPAGLTYAHAGDLVYVDIGNFKPGEGAVGRMFYDNSIVSVPVARASADPVQGRSPLFVNFTGSASSDADGDPLTYAWDFGDGGTSTEPNPQHIYLFGGAYTATLTVTDPADRGATDTATVRVTVNGPEVTVDSPLSGSLYKDGSPVGLTGKAFDAGGKRIDDANLRWQVILHHGPSHVHQLGWFANGASFVPFVDHGADSWYDVTLFATDGNGLTGWKTVSVYPQNVTLTLASNPPGAPMTYAGRSLLAPFAAPEAIGFRASLSAAEQFVAGDGGTYVFDSWSDGGPRQRTVTIGDGPVTLTANYAGPGGGTAGAVTPAGTKPGGADRHRLTLRINALAAALRRGRLSGTVSDPSNVRSVEVSVRERHRGRKCRWWSTSRRRLGARRSCTAPVWIRAKLTGRSWTASLGGSLPRGSYLVYVRATDRRGNSTSQVIAVERR